MSGDGIFKLILVKELFCCRGKKIFAGLQEGATAFPASPYLIPVIVAVLKECHENEHFSSLSNFLNMDSLKRVAIKVGNRD